MDIILTSFRDAKNWKGSKFSIARWQPLGLHYPSFPIPIAPYYKGRPMVHLEPDDFRNKYEDILKSKEPELIGFFSSHTYAPPLVLLCWCNLDRQRDHNKLYCHRILLGYWIERHFPSINVIYADGAEKPLWEKSWS